MSFYEPTNWVACCITFLRVTFFDIVNTKTHCNYIRMYVMRVFIIPSYIIVCTVSILRITDKTCYDIYEIL